MILELCGGEPGEVTEAGAEPPPGSATPRCASHASPGLAAPTFRRTRRLRRWNASASRCRAATRHRSPSRCRPGATTSPRRSRWINRRDARSRRSRRRPPKAAREIEPECDLVEEVLRLRGLDAVPPVSLPRVAPVPLATLTPRQAPRRAGPPHPGRAGPGGVRHLQLHGRRRGGAVRRHAGGAAPDQPDRRRSRPACARRRSRRWPSRRKRNAARGYPDVALFEVGPEFADRCAGRAAAGRRRPAHRCDAAQLAGAAAAGRCDGRQGRSVGRDGRGRRAAGGADADAGRPGLLPSRPLRHSAAGAEDRAGTLRRTASTRAGGARPRRTGRRLRTESRRRRRSEAPPQGRRPTCRRSSRSGATSPSWWTPRSPPMPCCAPPGVPIAR